MALSHLKRLAIGVALYMATVALVGVLAPRHTVDIGQDLCSDDWCIAVTAHDIAPGDPTAHAVTFRLRSRSARVSQRELSVVAWLTDSAGDRYDAAPDATQPPFDVTLASGQAVSTVRRFVVPRDARIAGVIIAREGGGNFPRCCIINEDNSLFHKRAMVRLARD